MFAKEVRERCNVHKILVLGSFARKDLNEGSDIDIIIVGDFKGRFHKRIAVHHESDRSADRASLLYPGRV